MTYEESVKIVSEYFDKSVMTVEETEAFQTLLAKVNKSVKQK